MYGLQHCYSLITLNASLCSSLRDISAFSNCRSLEKVYLCGCEELSRISALQSCVGLKMLNVLSTSVRDLVPLGMLSRLHDLRCDPIGVKKSYIYRRIFARVREFTSVGITPESVKILEKISLRKLQIHQPKGRNPTGCVGFVVSLVPACISEIFRKLRLTLPGSLRRVRLFLDICHVEELDVVRILIRSLPSSVVHFVFRNESTIEPEDVSDEWVQSVLDPEGLRLNALRLFEWNCQSSISNIAPMVNCWASTLEYFVFKTWDNLSVVDISALSQCSHLRFLDLSFNCRSPLTPLSSCISLESLRLGWTTVTEVLPLKGCRALRVIHCNLSDEELQKSLPGVCRGQLKNPEVDQWEMDD